MRSGSLSRLWPLLPACAALAWFWPVLAHGFRSDDFLAVYYLERDTGAVRWGRVLEEWVRPWFGVRDLYRPLVSASYGVNWSFGTGPFGFHLFNLLLLCGSATAAAALGARLSRSRRWLGGLAAGLLVAWHPAAVEPAAWIAARTTGLQVFFSILAYWSFARWRDGDGRGWVPLAAVALACASKEGAVLLPLSLVLLDLVRGRGLPDWRVHGRFFALVGGYLLLRRLLLGVFTTAEEGHTIAERLGGAGMLLAQLVAPPGAGGDSPAFRWSVAAGALVGLALVAWRDRRALWTLPWMFVLLTPGTTHTGRQTAELAGRFVFDAVPALSVLIALAATSGVRRWSGGVAALGGALLAVGLAVQSSGWIGRYTDESEQIDAVQRELMVRAAHAAPGRPYGVVGLPGLPLLQPPLWGFLTLRPFAPRDLPVLGLGNMLERAKGAERVFADPAVVHALVANGAGCGVWDPERRRLRPVEGVAPGAVEFVRDPGNPRRFLPPRLLPPTAVASLEVTVPGEVERMAAEIVGNLPGALGTPPFEIARPSGRNRGGPWTAELDATHVLPWFVAWTLGGGVTGLELSARGVRVRARSRLERWDLSADLPDRIERDDLARWLEPGGAEGRVRGYLLLPTGLFGFDPEGREGSLPSALRDQVVYAAEVLGGAPVHWFWIEERAPRRARMSPFAAAIVR